MHVACHRSVTHTHVHTPSRARQQLLENVSQPISHQHLDRHESCVSGPHRGSLHLNIHQHFGYSVHVTWRIGADVTMSYHSAADRCFARWFDTDHKCDSLCKELKHNQADGLYDFMGYLEYMLRLLRALNRIRRCHLYHLPKSKPWTNQS